MSTSIATARAVTGTCDRPTARQRILLAVGAGLVTAAFGLLCLRLYHVQVLDHELHLRSSSRILRRQDKIAAVRGDVRSDEGVILARDVLAYDLGLDPRFIDRQHLIAAVTTACDTLGVAIARRRECVDRALRYQGSGKRYVPLGFRVEKSKAERVRDALQRLLPERQFAKGLSMEQVTRRIYPRGEFLSQVLGTVNLEGQGVEGLELAAQPLLASRPGSRSVLIDAGNRLRFFFPENAEVAPVNGLNVYLTVDTRIQRILEEELEAGSNKFSAAAGLGVVMDCNTGAVLAMASWPSYDPNHYHRYPRAELERRRTNRVIESTYEPGSVLKPFIAAWALELGLFGREELVWGGGRTATIRAGGATRTVHDVSDHGAITFEDALVYSSNIGMTFVGLRLGGPRIVDALRSFGFARKTGIFLPFELPGRHTPLEQWKEAYSTPSVAFGYEVMVTPLQLCTAFAALVNGGYLLKPRIVARYGDGDEEMVNPPVVVGRPVTEATSRAMREMLLRVVQEGTGQWLRMEGFEFGGKTGTADMGPRYTKTNYLASFEAFAPYDAPEVVVLVMVEKPQGKYYGGSVAGPIVAKVLRRIFRVHAEPRIVKLGR